MTEKEKDETLCNYQAYIRSNDFKTLENWMATTVPPGRGAGARFSDGEREEIRTYARKMEIERRPK